MDHDLGSGWTTHEGDTPLTAPPFLYLPCTAAADGTPELQYRTTRTGQEALITYTTLDQLLEGCGAGQPWTLLTAEQLEEVLREHPVDLIVTDVPKPEEQRIPGDPPPAGALPPLAFAPCLQHVERLEDATIAYLRTERGV